MLSIAIKNLLCFLLYVEGERKKFRSTKFLCDNKKFRLANNIDAYAITLFFLFFFTSKHRVVAVELYQKKERRQKLWKVTRSFFILKDVYYIAKHFQFSNFYFYHFFTVMATNTVEARKNIKFMCFIILYHLSLTHSLVLAKEIYLFYSYIFQRAVKMS